MADGMIPSTLYPNVGIGMMANLIEAVQNFSLQDCRRIIEGNPESVNAAGWMGFTPLHKASLRGNPEIVQLLLDNDAKVNAANNAGELPIHYACKRGNPIVIHLLVSHGARLDEVDSLGRGCMHHASQAGSVYAMQYLSHTAGMGFMDKDHSGLTPLHIVSQFGHFDCLRYLLKNQRTDVGVTDNTGNMPLHLACQNAQAEVVWVLLQKGTIAHIHQENNTGESPLDIARDGTSYRHGPLAQELAYWGSVKDQSKSPKGPLFTWYFLLLLPALTFTSISVVAEMLGSFGGVISFFSILYFAFFIGKQMHRIAHISRWANPIFAGAFAGGILQTSICYFYLVLPAIWPSYFYLGFSSFLLMVYLYMTVLLKDPGRCTVPRKGPGKDSPYMTIEHVATKELRLDHYCSYCEMSLPDRTRHCKLCESCMVGMDHHCLFLMKCIASNNHLKFIYLIIVTMITQVLFLVSAFEFLRVNHPGVAVTDYFQIVFSQRAWLFTICFVNFMSIVWGLFLLKTQFEVIAYGYTTVMRPPMHTIKEISFPDKLNNVVSFLLGRKTQSAEEIIELRTKQSLEMFDVKTV
ncbi:uncharacterized protein [Ptychodera flava]|uniref:uncharacterized protein n=1 Tax=Ptychodera flava TaxID=63121 RepID=UPI00396A3BEC